MKRAFGGLVAALALVLFFLALALAGGRTSAPLALTPTAYAYLPYIPVAVPRTALPTPTATPSPSPTLSPSVTPTSTVSPTPTSTVTPTLTPTATPTACPTTTLTPTITPTPTSTATPTASPLPTATPTPSPTATPTASPLPTATLTPSPTATPTASPSPTVTPSVGPTNTPGMGCDGKYTRQNEQRNGKVYSFEVTNVSGGDGRGLLGILIGWCEPVLGNLLSVTIAGVPMPGGPWSGGQVGLPGPGFAINQGDTWVVAMTFEYNIPGNTSEWPSWNITFDDYCALWSPEGRDCPYPTPTPIPTVTPIPTATPPPDPCAAFQYYDESRTQNRQVRLRIVNYGIWPIYINRIYVSNWRSVQWGRLNTINVLGTVYTLNDANPPAEQIVSGIQLPGDGQPKSIYFNFANNIQTFDPSQISGFIELENGCLIDY